jgi:hypothetical protein
VDYTFDLLAGDYLDTYDLSASGYQPEDSTIITPHYERRFYDRWLQDEMKITAGSATGVDVLDHQKSLFAPGTCNRSEDTFTQGEGGFVVNKSGPVRAIRSYFGANSGPLTQREHVFYQGREDIRTFLRVHSIPGIMTFFDYSPDATGMVYYNSNNPGGVVIDGVPDTVAAGAFDWELVTGAQGTVLILPTLVTDIPSLSVTSYYLDDVTPQDNQCFGDDWAYGASGLWLDQTIPNTDPSLGAHNVLEAYQTLYYEAPGQDVSYAEQMRQRLDSPVTFVASAWEPVDAAPRVARVLVKGSNWSPEFLDYLDAQGYGHATKVRAGYRIPDGTAQLDALAWNNVDQIVIAFNEEVVVAEDDLALYGVSVGDYGAEIGFVPGSFSYDPIHFVAMWTLQEPIPGDRLQIELDAGLNGVADATGNPLDGEWEDETSSFPSGNGSAGGDFQFRVDVLPASFDADDDVDAFDLLIWQNDFGQTMTIEGDAEGDGDVDAFDLLIWQAGFGGVLPPWNSGDAGPSIVGGANSGGLVTGDHGSITPGQDLDDGSGTGALDLASWQMGFGNDAVRADSAPAEHVQHLETRAESALALSVAWRDTYARALDVRLAGLPKPAATEPNSASVGEPATLAPEPADAVLRAEPPVPQLPAGAGAAIHASALEAISHDIEGRLLWLTMPARRRARFIDNRPDELVPAPELRADRWRESVDRVLKDPASLEVPGFEQF